MGLLSIIRKTKRKEREMRILMLGLDNAGKTTCVKRFCGKDTSSISPTLGFQITAFSLNGCTLNIWDVGGQQSLRSYWRNYFESTDGLIWVVDSNDVGRLEDCKCELHTLLKEERLAGASLLIFMNKQDISGALTPAEIERRLDVEVIRQGKRHVHLCACSAMTGSGLLEGMEWIVQDVSSRMYFAN
ncbi:putative ADP ribosylation factor family Signal recognition particle [Trypanosoma vivax]|uniref:ADP-ribosylation factor-like protein 2 n=1 Tax=Trypanosoma vivax (strain Y486) TaxID=1055687 RepID=G0U668_TRYVY|nr:ADP-ribosylation factor 6 [Trypanosoma vivax]KAH8608182.1 putative ADP ribosylation factor family Signal recognition particle [Trypanosoma vivax]CCC51371.1 putative ADP-ribosylation factor [Trypanosoma vivax Y486]